MATQDPNLKAFFLPYFTTSHLTPLVDTARLFAAHGLHVTIITTPSNALIFQSSLNPHHQITVHTIPFPSAEVDLPQGIENFGSVTSTAMALKLAHGISLLRKPMEQFIRDGRPDCIVSDMFYPWTVDVAEELNIPRLMLHASNCFYHCVFHNLKVYAPHEKVQCDTEAFMIPDLPDKIEMTRSQLQDHLKTKTKYGEVINEIKESELRSFGIIFTSYSELEPDYVEHYKKVLGRKCRHVGLPSLSLQNNSITQQHSCLNWLDNQKPNTVLYVCFGSMIRFPDTQLNEIALALEASDHPFVWVVRKGGKTEEKEDESWLPERFEQRVKETNKGMIVREWAPQVLILSHRAIGGFMTHCGWNSVLESVAAGVPLITWPLFAEQFYNEKLITRVLKIGVEVGSGVWNPGFEIRSPVVGKDDIVKAVSCLMGGSEEVQEIRLRAKELSLMVKRSVEEGGSSYSDLNALIEEIKARVFQKE
ncbi:Soyasapogenol B glucuronide galactosyltransferase [Actinidia chinensis var. chinensis]|uniref:Glycosyltransferase n=1 Tax=Actinidia chinensis var. chinensis TaxID=1590841 RepID=A0A2R6RN51_ACTCC|nr:Soyasapogenol B glucuronide galactosyltransferase [Actinidia chinensis var. chinensis]